MKIAEKKIAPTEVGSGDTRLCQLGASLHTGRPDPRSLAPCWRQLGRCEQKKGARKNSGMEGVAHTLGGRRGAALLDVLRKLPKQGVDHA